MRIRKRNTNEGGQNGYLKEGSMDSGSVGGGGKFANKQSPFQGKGGFDGGSMQRFNPNAGGE